MPLRSRTPSAPCSWTTSSPASSASGAVRPWRRPAPRVSWSRPGSGCTAVRRAVGVGAEPAGADEPVVITTDLVKVYEPMPTWVRLLVRGASQAPVRALDGVSLSIHRGQICAIVGPNGAGKSTLFRILTGLTSATSGQVTVLGLDCNEPAQARRASSGFMPADDRSLLLRLSCRDN